MKDSLKTVMILGASRYYVRSIQAVRAAGYRVVAVDKNAASPGFAAADVSKVCDIVDADAVLDVARRYGVDGVMALNDYGVLTAAHITSQMGLPGISTEVAHAATRKDAMRKAWAAAGVPCPRVEVQSTRSGLRSAAERIGYPCILKPAHGVGGASRGVIVVTGPRDMDRAIKFSQSFYGDPATLVEEYVDARLEHSSEVLVVNGLPRVIAVADKVKTPLPYRVDKAVLYPSQLEGSEKQALERAICDAVVALGITVGAAHVELASTPKGPVLFELGARPGGGGTPQPIVPWVTGVPFIQQLARVLCGDELEIFEIQKLRGCAYRFITFPPGRVRMISGFDRVADHRDVLDSDLFIEPGDQIDPVRVGTDRSGFIIVGKDDRRQAETLAAELERMIDVVYD